MRQCCCRAQAQRPSVSTEAAHALLGIPPGSTKAEIRAAYIEQIKELHPDVNPARDTTGPAADLNAAYSHLLEVRSWFHMPSVSPTSSHGCPFLC